MKFKLPSLEPSIFIEKEYKGVYGHYTITKNDHIEVICYRIALLSCSIFYTLGLLQWLILDPHWAGLWLLPLSVSLGLSLKWIHIYLVNLHRLLTLFWAVGFIGVISLLIKLGPENMLTSIAARPPFILIIGPLFVALTGIGFKEFFCFQRPEAIGVTLLIPLGLLGHLSGLLNANIVISFLSISSFLLLFLTIRKFNMDTSADVGDKSVFDFLAQQNP